MCWIQKHFRSSEILLNQSLQNQIFFFIPASFLSTEKSKSSHIYNFMLYFSTAHSNLHNLSRYVKSRSDQQLLHGLGYNHTSSCKPLESSDNLPVVPCGLIAWSLFNDTYTFSCGPSELKVNRKNIAWNHSRWQ